MTRPITDEERRDAIRAANDAREIVEGLAGFVARGGMSVERALRSAYAAGFLHGRDPVASDVDKDAPPVPAK